MPWFKLSDDWLEHPKVQRAGKNGRALWVAAGNRCAKHSMDGLIEGDLLKGVAALADVPCAATARKLVEVKLWHDQDTVAACAKCMQDLAVINRWRRDEGMDLIVVGAGNFYSHDWAFHQLSAQRLLSPEARMAADRLKALHKDPGLTRQIQTRDKSLCRFCGQRVNWKARKGATYATYDHLDPWCYSPAGGNFLEGVVTACGPCNGDKGQRTVDEWVAAGGRTLKPAGWKQGDQEPAVDLPRIYSGVDPGQVPIYPGSDSGSTPTRAHGRADARLGPGQNGLGPGVGLGLVGAGPGLAGLVRGGSSPGLDGEAVTG